MRGSIHESRAPHDGSPLRKLSEPLVLAANMSLAASVYPAWKTARVTWDPGTEGLVDLVANRTTPMILYAWHAHELLAVCAFRELPSEAIPTAVGHDGIPSRMIQRFASWFGVPIWVYRRNSSVRPRDQIIKRVTRDRAFVALIPDAGGHHGRIRKGFAEVAQATGAQLIPLGLAARGAIHFRYPRRYVFPMPRARIKACWGQPFDASEATPESIGEALREQVRRASAG